MKAVVFLGPSLPVEEARTILDAIYLPPASQADILSAVHIHRPDAIGLIDGVFGQSLSVWHKEILYALDRGVAVYGASSMGALRAAETADFGTVGVGEIYEMYRSGALQDDDEVALLHGPADYGHKALTLPMVNVRATLGSARERGVLDAMACATLTAAAKSVFYAERTVEALQAAWAMTDVSAAARAAAALCFETAYVDLKRSDAERMLRAMAARPAGAPPPPLRLQRTYLFDVLRTLDRRVTQQGIEVSLETVARTSALHDPDFSDLNLQAANRAVVALFAQHLEIRVSPEEVAHETQRFRRRRQLEDEASLAGWLRDNDLELDELHALMRDMALCRAMQRWLSARAFLERNTPCYLDELRLQGRYRAAVQHAASIERVVQGTHPEVLWDEASAVDASFEDLFVEHVAESACMIDAGLTEWMHEAGFRSREELREHLWRARKARRSPGGTGAEGIAPTC